MTYELASPTWNDDEIDVAISVLRSGELSMGAQVSNFEREFAEYIGTKYAVMFNSGSSANLGMVAAMRYFKGSKIQEGDEIIVPSVSWSTTYYPVNQAGFVLNFVDIDPETLSMDINLVKQAINEKTRAIFAVNLLGNPAQLLELKALADEHNLYLIEDNCESLGAKISNKRTGSFGLAGAHSFYFSHHICTMEGGMVTTDSKELMEALVSIRAHGWTRGLEKDNSVYPKSENEWEDLFRFVLPGYNLRPIELSAAIGRVQLKKFGGFLSERRKNAAKFQEIFGNSSDFRIQQEVGESSWFGFSIVLTGKLEGKRTELIKFLTDKGIATRPIVAGNFAKNPVMKHLIHSQIPPLPNSDFIDTNGFFIGNHHFDVSTHLLNIRKLIESFVEGLN